VDFLTDAAPKIVFAFWLGVIVVALTLVMLSVILIMRQVMLRKERNHHRAAETWRKILVAADDGAPVNVTLLPGRDVSGFLEVWNELHAAHADHSAVGLQRVAKAVGLERHLFKVLDHHGGFHSQVVAITALGHLRNPDHFARVARFLDDKSPIVSLCAARALMQIDPPSAVSMFVPQIVRRGDWSQGSVSAILQEANSPQMANELSQAALQANAEVAPRLVRFLATVSPQEAAPVIRTILASEADDHLISTCLQVMTNPADLDSVRPLLQHPRWHVRMQAAATIGRLGVPGDEHLLVDLLSDEQWWVRYRTAQGLLKLPFIDEPQVRRIRDEHADHFARDILDHVLAERALAGAHA